MPDHEPLDIASRDDQEEGSARPEARAARVDRDDEVRSPLPQPSAPAPATSAADATAAASEPMELQRLPDAPRVPEGRQRTGDPPAKPPTRE